MSLACVSQARLQAVRNTLKQFEGTHNFHNYTSGKQHSDASAKRFIMHFQVCDGHVACSCLVWRRRGIICVPRVTYSAASRS